MSADNGVLELPYGAKPIIPRVNEPITLTFAFLIAGTIQGEMVADIKEWYRLPLNRTNEITVGCTFAL